MRTVLAPGDRLPLSCTREGTCCHGKDIRLTPWELAQLAMARGLSASAFRDAWCEDAGTRLRLAAPGWRGLPACGQYAPGVGCTVHAARPLACRLYPLGREVQDGRERIIHEGVAFPCLDGCPGVAGLPHLTVAEYLAGQGAAAYAAVRDGYLEMAQDLAEAAIAPAREGGLEDGRWREVWRLAISNGPQAWPQVLGSWYDVVTTPALAATLPPGEWLQGHAAALQVVAEEAAPAAACARLFCAALLLYRGVGGEHAAAGRRWCAAAGV